MIEFWEKHYSLGTYFTFIQHPEVKTIVKTSFDAKFKFCNKLLFGFNLVRSISNCQAMKYFQPFFSKFFLQLTEHFKQFSDFRIFLKNICRRRQDFQSGNFQECLIIPLCFPVSFFSRPFFELSLKSLKVKDCNIHVK